MWLRTYERLYEQTVEIEMRADDAIYLLTAKVAARLDRSNRKRSFRK